MHHLQGSSLLGQHGFLNETELDLFLSECRNVPTADHWCRKCHGNEGASNIWWCAAPAARGYGTRQNPTLPLCSFGPR